MRALQSGEARLPDNRYAAGATACCALSPAAEERPDAL